MEEAINAVMSKRPSEIAKVLWNLYSDYKWVAELYGYEVEPFGKWFENTRGGIDKVNLYDKG